MKSQRRPFNRTMFTGLALMAIANLTRWFVERHTSIPEDPRDAIVGVLFGLAIGTLILGLWRQTHGSPRSDCRQS